ncbi:MAG TPA: adenosine deaminase [Terriglobia bacterium]|nr:adenosine deaminase [Terriglobia bacterium]
MASLSFNLDKLVARLPKVELHLHLEGSVQPSTLRELARRKGRFQKETEEWIVERERTACRYGAFQDFLTAFKHVTLLLDTPADYALATKDLVEWLASQNVQYAEVILAAGVILWKNQSLEAVYEAVAAAALEAQSRMGLRVNWIFDAIRHFGPDHVREVLRYASRYRERGVVALGIGGDEGRGPARLFQETFREARELGLHVVAHAGESVGPESIREAVELLGAERIGHGLTAMQDPGVIAMLRSRQIPIEVCPTSNVCTGLIGRLGDHPLPRMLQEGLLVTLNSDDPAMFGTSLSAEFLGVAKEFGFSPALLTQLSINAARASFLTSEEKSRVEAEILKAMSDRGNLSA